jgi:Domain of unknown function (DUF222)
MSQLLSVIDAMTAVDPHALGSAGLIVELEELIEARDRLDAVIASRLQAADVCGATVDECGRSTRGWLVEEMRRSPNEARRVLFVARSLPSYPLVASAFAAGDISADHARVIVSCLRELRTEQREWASEVLIEAARSMDPTTLGQVVLGIRLRTGADESREAAAERRYAGRWARAATTFDGMLHLEAMLDPEAGRTVVAALDALTHQNHTDHDAVAAVDARTVPQRRADALVDLAHYSLSGGVLPDHGGDRPTVMVTIDYQTLAGQIGDTFTAATLNGPYGPTPITPQAARRIACDADILPALLGRDGTILNLGRSQRTWTTTQRRAARLRDQGCVFPKCQASLNHCDLHHIQHWARGGPTDHDNSAHLCHFHHWLVHHKNWQIWRDHTKKKVQVRRT